MKRVLIITGLILGTITLVTVLATGLLFNTGAGRNFIAAQIEPQLEKTFGGEVEIGRLTGAPPGRIILHDVQLKDEAGAWLTLAEAVMVWSPLALAGRNIDINSLTVDGLTLYRLPPSKEEAQDTPSGFEFPEALPSVVIDTLTLNNIVIVNPETGDPFRFDGGGSLIMVGQKLNANLNLASTQKTDNVSALIDYDHTGDNATIDITVTSEVDGAITTLAQLDGPLSFMVKGSGAPEKFKTDIDALAGAFGIIDVAAVFDLNGERAVTITGDVKLGDKLGTLIQEVGGDITLDATITEKKNGAAVTIRNLQSPGVQMNGDISWTNRRKQLEQVRTTFEAVIGSNYLDTLTRHTGRNLHGTAVIDQAGDAFKLTASATSERASLTIDEARTDLSKTFVGPVSIRFNPRNDVIPLLQKGASLKADTAIDLDTSATLKNATLDLGDIRSFSGEMSYGFQDESIRLVGTANASPATITALHSDIAAANALEADIDISGTTENFTAQFKADLPQLMMNESVIPASTVTANLNGLPTRPTGDINAHAINGEGKLAAMFRSSADGRIAVRNLNFSAKAFSLTGEAEYDPTPGALAVDLAYEGEDGATPFPGLPFSGTATLKGAVSNSGDNNKLVLEAEKLQSTQFQIAKLRAETKGPSGALTVSANGTGILINGAEPISSLTLKGLASLENSPELSLSNFDMDYGDLPIKLTDTARLTFSDGVTVKNLKATIGEKGTLALDGAFTAQRLVATINAKDLLAQEAAAFASFNVNLDTDREQLAYGDFSLLADTLDNENARLSGKYQWTAGQLRISETENDNPLTIDLSIPLKLIRKPSLSVEVQGPLGGTVTYDGAVEPLAAFMPSQFQSLEGILKANAALGGSMRAPEVKGSARFADGAYTDLSTGFSLDNMSMDADALVRDGETKITLKGSASGAGQSEQTINLNGDITLGDGGLLDVVLTMNNARFAAEPVTNVDASGEIKISGSLDNPTAAGEITISELNAEIITPETTGLVNIDVVAIDKKGAPLTLTEPTSPPRVFNYDVLVKADDKIFVRGRGLESEWSADIETKNADAGPLILGEINLRRGFLDFSGRRFNLTDGKITFNRLSPNNPYLDIQAEYETGDGVVARIVIGGRGKKPSVELESNPSLPREDIMALVLFGKPANELSAVESVQMASALAQLGGLGPFGGGGLTGSARQALGLDMLNLDLDPENGASALTVGKYVADGLFVSATQDVKGENSSVRVEYEIINNITVETELKQDGDQTVSANWKKDF